MDRASKGAVTIPIVLRRSRSTPGRWIGQVPLLGVQGRGESVAAATLDAQLAAVKQMAKLMELALEEPARGEVPLWSPVVRRLARIGFDTLCQMLNDTGLPPALLEDIFTVSTPEENMN